DNKEGDEEPPWRPIEATDRKEHDREQCQRQSDRVADRERSGHRRRFGDSHLSRFFPRKKRTLTQVGLAPLLSLLIDQDRLLPSAPHLIGAMNAAYPAAGALLAFQEFVTGSLDATLACLWLFCVLHPTDELVATQRRQVFPPRKYF